MFDVKNYKHVQKFTSTKTHTILKFISALRKKERTILGKHL